jgi:transcriptional regulator with XRE-family HTH domain
VSRSLPRRTAPTELELLISILRVAIDRRARDQLIRFVANHFDVSRRELAVRIGLSHASVSRIVRRKQGLGESDSRSVAALRRWSRILAQSRRQARG